MDSLIYDLSRHLTYRIARLQAQFNAQASDILKQNADISLSEWRVLAVLSNPKVKTQKDMLESMGLDKGQISRTVKRLEAKDMIILSSPEHDQRQRKIALSPKGQKLVETIFPVMMKRQEHLQTNFSTEEMNMLFHLLEKLETRTGPIEGLSSTKSSEEKNR